MVKKTVGTGHGNMGKFAKTVVVEVLCYDIKEHGDANAKQVL
jgi:hypothetical protein